MMLTTMNDNGGGGKINVYQEEKDSNDDGDEKC